VRSTRHDRMAAGCREEPILSGRAARLAAWPPCTAERR
jgi:hypothetical protein